MVDSHHLSPLERFWKYTKKLPNGCWVWTGHRNSLKKGGHSRFYFEGHLSTAHRFAYEHWIEPVPKGYDLHHACNHTWCVNPKHLRPIPHGDHSYLSQKHQPKPMTPARMFCPRGHRLAGDNLLPNGAGWLWCRECRRMHQWCLRHGLKITHFTVEQLEAFVPPRKRWPIRHHAT